MTAHPVTISVKRSDGTLEQVRVGTAYKEGDSFRLEMGQLTIGGAPVSAPAARAAPSSSGGSARGGMVFPNYGRSKGQPVEGASMGDLEFYAGGCRRTLDDPGKSRWHDKERELLAAIEAEMARQGGGGAVAPSSSGVSSRGRQAGPDESPPPLSDDDIPF